MDDNTLDPPGTIAIVMDRPGDGGPAGDAWGLEVMLYARYLGFQAKLFSPKGFVLDATSPEGERFAPTIPTSPLGLAALAAQRGLGETMVTPQIASVADWYATYLEPLAGSDLIGEHIEVGCSIESIGHAEPLPEDDSVVEEDEDADLPPDFLIHWRDASGEAYEDRFEAIIDVRCIEIAAVSHLSALDAPDYYFSLGWRSNGSAQVDSVDFSQICQFFAALTERSKLDVYANLGGFS